LASRRRTGVQGLFDRGFRQCGAVWYSVVQCAVDHTFRFPGVPHSVLETPRIPRSCTAWHCSSLHHTATHINTLLHTVRVGNVYEVGNTVIRAGNAAGATHCIRLRLTATHCNSMQHTVMSRECRQHSSCNSLQHTSTLYMYVYICIYMYTYVYTYIYIYIHIYLYVHIYIYTYIYSILGNYSISWNFPGLYDTLQYMYICAYFDKTCIHVCIHMYRYIYICIYIYVYIYVCVYLYACIYVYVLAYFDQRGSRLL